MEFPADIGFIKAKINIPKTVGQTNINTCVNNKLAEYKGLNKIVCKFVEKLLLLYGDASYLGQASARPHGHTLTHRH